MNMHTSTPAAPTPDLFLMHDAALMRRVMHDYPLATLVCSGNEGLQAAHIPLIAAEEGGHLRLQGHITRHSHLACMDGAMVMAVFHGPSAYISPSWYPRKKESGRVVPTWNYVSVQAHGELRLVHDTQWLLRHLRQLTDQQESGEPEPWTVDDAPAGFVEEKVGALIGIEVRVARLHGRAKTSQNQSPAEARGVMAGLRQRQDVFDRAMAEWMSEHLPLPPAD